jgi:hypothetical protein
MRPPAYLALLPLAAAGCGVGADTAVSVDRPLQCSAQGQPTRTQSLPLRALSLPLPSAAPPPAEPRAFGQPVLVWLNRQTASYRQAIYDNSATGESAILQKVASATVPGYVGSDASWQTVVSCIHSEFSRFNVTFTETRPTSGVWVEAHFGGDTTNIGEAANQASGYAAPDFTTCKVVENAIVMIFTAPIGGDTQFICETAAMEIAHAFALDHEYLCQDPMTYLDNCGPKTFQDKTVQCGEFSPRACPCNKATQNSVQMLLQQVGPAPVDNTPPTVDIVAPSEGQQVPAGPLQVVVRASDDRDVAKIELHVGSGATALVSTCGDNVIPCMRSGDTATFTVASPQSTLQAVAYDGANNRGQSAVRTIQVAGGGGGGSVNIGSGDLMLSVIGGGMSYTAGSQLVLQIQALSSGRINRMSIRWTDPAGASMEMPACDLGGGKFDAAIQLGPNSGNRSFIITAGDDKGQRTSTPPQQVRVP